MYLNFNDNIALVEQAVYKCLGKKEALQTQRDTVQSFITQAITDKDLYSRCKRILEVLVRTSEHRLQHYIEPVITEGLEFVFEQGLYFHLLFATRRNQIEVDFILLRDRESEQLYQTYIKDLEQYEKDLENLVKDTKNILFMYGGAVNQVIALILRLIVVELLQIKGPVVFDEPSSAVSEEYNQRLGQLVSSLSKRFNRQIIFITHSRSLAAYADVVQEVSKLDNISVITKQ